MDMNLGAAFEEFVAGLTPLLDLEAGLREVTIEQQYAQARIDLANLIDADAGLAVIIGTAPVRPEPSSGGPKPDIQIRASEASSLLLQQPDTVRLLLRSTPGVIAFHLLLTILAISSANDVHAVLRGNGPRGVYPRKARALANDIVRALETTRFSGSRLLPIAKPLLNSIELLLYADDQGRDPFYRPEFVDNMTAAVAAARANSDLTRPQYQGFANETNPMLRGRKALKAMFELATDLTSAFDDMYQDDPTLSQVDVRTQLQSRMLDDLRRGKPEVVEAELDEARTDFTRADLSSLEGPLPNMEGVCWSADTRWPREWEDDILSNSIEIKEGIYQVRYGSAGVILVG